MSVKVILFLGVSLLLAACSGGGGSSSNNNSTPPPLASEQSVKFTQTLDGIGRIQRVAQQSNRMQANMAIADVLQSSVIDDHMRERIQDARCQVLLRGLENLNPSMDPNAPPQDLKAKMTIGGNGCPVSANYLINLRVNMNQQYGDMGVNYRIDAKFAILDDQMAQENGVRSFTMSGSGGMSIKMGADQQSASMTLSGGVTGTAQNYDGTTVTISNSISGNLNTNASGSFGSMNVKWDFKYADFTAELSESHRYSGKDDVVSSYTLNGQTLNEQDYQDYENRLGMLAIAGNSQSSSQSNQIGQN